MNESSHDELAALRARAYGPHPDIQADPAAVERLRALEDAIRVQSALRLEVLPTVEAGEPDPPSGLRDARTVSADARDDASSAHDEVSALLGGLSRDASIEGEPEGAPSMPMPMPRPVARAWLIAWAASVLVVAVAVGGVVFGLASIPVVSAATGARQIATLDTPSEMPSWLKSWSGTTDQDQAAVYRYRGLVVARTPTGIFQQGVECLFVVAEDDFNEDTQSLDGDVFTGCRAGEFPATVQFVIGPRSPAALRDEFPEGTALQLVLVGGTIGVFSDVGSAATPIPAVAS